MVVENIRKSIATKDFSIINNFDFCELRIGSTVIMEKFTNKWVMERRTKIIRNMDTDMDTDSK